MTWPARRASSRAGFRPSRSKASGPREHQVDPRVEQSGRGGLLRSRRSGTTTLSMMKPRSSDARCGIEDSLVHVRSEAERLDHAKHALPRRLSKLPDGKAKVVDVHDACVRPDWRTMSAAALKRQKVPAEALRPKGKTQKTYRARARSQGTSSAQGGFRRGGRRRRGQWR